MGTKTYTKPHNLAFGSVEEHFFKKKQLLILFKLGCSDDSILFTDLGFEVSSAKISRLILKLTS